MKISFFVPGEPIGKGRPKFARRGNFVKTYTPEKTANYETLVGWYAKESMPEDHNLMELPLTVEVYAIIGIPSSFSKKKRDMAINGDLHPTKKPDADNIIKGIFDAMNGIVYVDDKQIVKCLFVKVYGETPGVHIHVEEIL